MDNFQQPMVGSGMFTDIMSGEPQARTLTKEEEKKESRRYERERAEQLLLSEITRETEAREIYRRLISDTFNELYTLFTEDMEFERTWRSVQKIRIKLQVMEDTIGRLAIDSTAKYVLMGQLARILHSDIPPKSEVLHGGE